MSQSGCPVGDRILVGYILPEKKVKNSENDDSDWEDDDEEEEEEAQPEFLDMKEMDSVSSGGHVFNSSVPGRNEVDFLDSVSGKRCRVLGRFSLKDPWWEATCTARVARGKLVLRGYPAYRLRSDLQGDPEHSVLSLFLTACGVDSQFVVPFFAWLPMGRKVEFANLQEVLAEFEEGEQHRALAQQIKALVSVSVAGMRVAAASLYPHVMRYLPTLLPGRFTELLSRGKKSPKHPAAQGATQIEGEEEDLSLLAKIEEMIKTDVWKLGFNYVMYKELKVVHCEAQLRSFHECKLFQEIPLKQCNALRVYDSLKNHCNRTGSTYMELPTLCDEVRRGCSSEVEVWDAVHFLKELGVVVRDRQKVALQNLHSYETGIAECLRCLVQEEPWVIPLDVIEVLTASALQRLRKKGGDGWSREDQGEVDSDAERKANELNERCDMVGSAAETDRTSTAVRTASGASVPDHIKPGPAPTDQGPPPPVDLDPDQGPPVDLDPDQGPPVDLDSDQGPPVDLDPDQGPPVDLDPDQGPPVDLDPDQGPPVDLDPDQVRAAEMICFNPVTVISGKGGCGKTTVVSLVFKAALQQSPEKEVRKACWDFENDSLGSEAWEEAEALEDEALSKSLLSQLEGEVKDEKKLSSWVLQGEDEVLLTAPTGRAASLLTKRTCFKAYTLHQVVWSFMQAKKDPSGAPEEWKFACVRVLVVDEGSLVCVQLLHSVLTMLTKHAQLRKFVILGDVRQLPSIQPGNTLYDLFHSLGRAHWAIEMRTNHRAESQLIVDNAGQIAEMGMNRSFRPLHYDAILDLNGSYTMPSEDKRFILILLPNTTEDSDYGCGFSDLQVAIELLLKAAPGLKNDATSQFIAFRRRECALINELCCKHYCDHRTKNNKNRLDFQPRDKVCCTKNGYVTDRNKEVSPEEEDLENSYVSDRARTKQRLPGLDGGERRRGNGATQRDGSGDKMKSKEKNKERLCNGEIFFIKYDVTEEEAGSRRSRKQRYLTLDDGDGRMLCVSFRELQSECKLQHAWARTIHTFQGSETETIVYVLGNGSVQTWKHVYTAVTRGQKRVYVIAKKEGMASAIKRRIIPRNTRLGTLVKELLVQPGAEGQDQPDQNQPQPGTPRRAAPGFGPTQTSPLASPTPSWSLRTPYKTPIAAPRLRSTPSVAVPLHANCVQSHSTSVLPRKLWRNEPPTAPQADASDTSLMDDITFSQAYTWSPMNSSSEDPSQEQPGSCEEEEGIEMEASSSAVEDGHMGKGSHLAARSGVESTPSKRTLSPDSEKQNVTPHKQIKVEPFESPLGCSRLQQLTLCMPTSHGKRLFQGPPSDQD
ncbi:DNA helicase B isoform X1 [Oncorhynchus kisutch]|uniref:DNA helicase B isoform X1 n=1 Tax=Oncorhynchus kisutch TaxID=8019 RepID=UPI0012DC5C7C|nr:DNA helicase B isoform X1 [Oncorhynchus kisutch]